MAIALTTQTGLNCPSDMGSTAPFAVLEMIESPDSAAEPARAHPGLDTTVQVVDGIVYVVADEQEWVLTAGTAATIPAGVSFRRWNAGEEGARWVEVYCSSGTRH
jgi:mannose-6-phosphate isomerase-like protein (cupin superfamily)